MKTLIDFLVSNAKTYPDKIAVVDGDVCVTYQELLNKVNSFAGFLVKNNLNKGDRVSLLLENSAEYIVGYYGIIAAGGVVVGLNSISKSRDIVNCVKHSGSSWLIVNDNNQEFITVEKELQDIPFILVTNTKNNNLPASHYKWNDVTSASEKLSDEYLYDKDDNNQLAAIIYTSGTTGNPKGVTLSHSNLVANTKSIIEYLQLTHEDKVVNVLPFYYSYGNSVLHTHIAVGGTVIIEKSFLYPHKVLYSMQEYGATGFYGVPSTYSLLLNRVNLADYKLPDLRYMAQAGGPMPTLNIKKILNVFKDIKFFVMYGQTEATARLCYLPPERLDDKPGSIGIAIPGVTVEIRDENDKKVEPGKIGQICAKGPNIMQGYWHDNENTKAVIRNGWLMTGDLATYDNEEFIYIKGRASEMIKSGAYRISPKEIEEVILEIDGVEEVAAVGIPDELLGQVVKAVIVKTTDVALAEKDIKQYCSKLLSAYKVPKKVEFIPELPKTASGKIKRYLLE